MKLLADGKLKYLAILMKFLVINKNLDELNINIFDSLHDLFYHLYKLKNAKSTHGWVLLWINLHASAFEMITILTRNYKLSLKTMNFICGKGV